MATQEEIKKSLQNLREWRKKHPWCESYYCAKSRCNDERNKKYSYYGGNGIKFLMTLEDFEFLWKRDNAVSMERPSIDRIDRKGNYTIENCRFIEMIENIRRGSDVCSPRKYKALMKANFATRFKKDIEKRKETLWCSKHQRVHCEAKHTSCRFPNKEIKNV